MKFTGTFEIARKTLWSEVMGSGWELFPWWHSVNYSGDWDNERYGVTITYYTDPDDMLSPTATVNITADDLARAYQAMLDRNLLRSPDDTANPDFDSNEGDNLIQTAIFGTITFG